jgi:hypothetical protein
VRPLQRETDWLDLGTGGWSAWVDYRHHAPDWQISWLDP